MLTFRLSVLCCDVQFVDIVVLQQNSHKFHKRPLGNPAEPVIIEKKTVQYEHQKLFHC